MKGKLYFTLLILLSLLVCFSGVTGRNAAHADDDKLEDFFKNELGLDVEITSSPYTPAEEEEPVKEDSTTTETTLSVLPEPQEEERNNGPLYFRGLTDGAAYEDLRNALINEGVAEVSLTEYTGQCGYLIDYKQPLNVAGYDMSTRFLMRWKDADTDSYEESILVCGIYTYNDASKTGADMEDVFNDLANKLQSLYGPYHRNALYEYKWQGFENEADYIMLDKSEDRVSISYVFGNEFVTWQNTIAEFNEKEQNAFKNNVNGL